MQGQLTDRELTAVIDTRCAHCAVPLRIEVSSSLGCRLASRDAAPVVSVPLVNLKRLKDPSIIHAF